MEKKPGEIKKIATGGFMFFAGNGVISVLAYGFHLFAARFLSVENYGSLQSITSLLNIFLIPISVVTTLLTAIAAEHKKENLSAKSFLLMRKVKKFIFFPGIFIFGMLFFLTPWLKSFFQIFSSASFFFLWIGLYFSLFQGINGSFLNGWHKFYQFNFANVASGVAKFFFGIFLMGIGWGVSGSMGGIAIGFLAGFLLSEYFSWRFFAKERSLVRVSDSEKEVIFTKKKFFSLLGHSYAVILGIISVTVFSNVDSLIAKHHFGLSEAGHYGAIFILSKVIFFAAGSFAGLIIPLVAAEKNSRKKELYFIWLILANLSISAVGVAVFYFFPEMIISLLFGREYFDIAPYLAKFGLVALLLGCLNVLVQYFISLKHKRILLFITLNSFLEVLLLWFFGKTFNDFFLIVFLSLLVANVGGFFYFLKKRKTFQ